jgi:glucose/arabinose dehydrogenase
MMTNRWAVSVAVAVLLLLSACSGDGGTAEVRPTGSPAPSVTEPTGSPAPSVRATPSPVAPPPAAQLAKLKLTATKVADGPELLTSIAWRPGDPVPYLADQEGRVFRLVGRKAVSVLDWTAQVVDWLQDSERGLMGMTFDPVDGRLILGYRDNDNYTRIVSFAVGADGVPDPGSVREILRVRQPGLGHNIGQLAFDTDNNLWISMGDGGGSHGADAQDPNKLLGKMLRITPNRSGKGYTVPRDNPFVGDDKIRDEIWALGLRNPFRFSIDHPTGDIWIGSVGQDTYETVYRLRRAQAGANLGWPRWEGSYEINFSRKFKVPDDAVKPIHQYKHNGGAAVIGGYVYRGTAIPDLAGAYVFMNLYRPVWAMGAGGTKGVVKLNLKLPSLLTSFGEDPHGELWILSLFDGVYKIGPA